MGLPFWLPIVIRQLRTFFSQNFLSKKYGIRPNCPREGFFHDGSLLQKKGTDASLDIIPYLDSSENLRKIIWFNLFSCQPSPEVMSTLKSGLRKQRIKQLVWWQHLHLNSAKFSSDVKIVCGKWPSLRMVIIGTSDRLQGTYRTQRSVNRSKLSKRLLKWTLTTLKW